MSQEHNNYKKKYNDWEINEKSQIEYKHILSHFFKYLIIMIQSHWKFWDDIVHKLILQRVWIAIPNEGAMISF